MTPLLAFAFALAAAPPAVSLDADGGSLSVPRGPFDLVVAGDTERRVRVRSLPPTLLGLPIGKGCGDDIPDAKPWAEPSQVTTDGAKVVWLSAPATPKAPAEGKPAVATFPIRDRQLLGPGRRYCIEVLARDHTLADDLIALADSELPEEALRDDRENLRNRLPNPMGEEEFRKALLPYVECPASPHRSRDDVALALRGGLAEGATNRVVVDAGRRAEVLDAGEEGRLVHGALEGRAPGGPWTVRLPQPEQVLKAPDGELLWPLLQLAEGRVPHGGTPEPLTCRADGAQRAAAEALLKRWRWLRAHPDDPAVQHLDEVLSGGWTDPETLETFLAQLAQWHEYETDRKASARAMAGTLVVGQHTVTETVDQKSWLGDYLQASAGISWYHHQELGLVPQPVAGLTLSALPNPADVPMWTRGGEDLGRLVHAQLHVRTASNEFGEGRLTSPDDGLPVVGFGVGLQVLPYTYLSYGRAWVGDTRGGSDPERLWLPTYGVGFHGDLAGASFQAIKKLTGG